MGHTSIFPLAAVVVSLKSPYLYRYDVNKSGVNRKKSGQNTNLTGSSRGQVAPMSAPSRGGKISNQTLLSDIVSVLLKKHGKRISRDINTRSCRTQS